MSARNLKLKASEASPAIDWRAVDAAPKASLPDDDSPPLTRAQAAQLRPLAELLPMFSTRKTRITIRLQADSLPANDPSLLSDMLYEANQLVHRAVSAHGLGEEVGHYVKSITAVRTSDGVMFARVVTLTEHNYTVL